MALKLNELIVTNAINASITGNAGTATTLQTARTIGGVSFNGSADINLPGVNTAGNQNTSGNAATATILQTARNIGGVSFNGSADINLPGVNTTGNQNTSGNAATATTSTRLSDATNGLRIANPGGGSYATNTSSVTGAIKIKLPTAAFKSNTMFRFTVKIYQYAGSSAGLSRTIEVGGYNYSDAAANWYNYFAYQNTMGGGEVNVRFGNDGTSNCVWIGEVATGWDYPQVTVTDFQAGYSNYTDAIWSTGWAISFATAFDTVTQGPIIAAKPLNSQNSAFAYNMNQNVRTTDTCSFATVNATTLTGAHSAGSVNVTSVNGAYLGVNNTTNTNGYGISLYNGASAGEPTYGLMFQGTATFGTHGSVTGDWSTYFTMNNDNTRGWIFRKVGIGNVASISAGGVITATTFVGALTGTASGNLTAASTLTAGNLSGTIPSGVLGNSTLYVGTTAITLNRTSSSQTLTGVSIDGNAATVTGITNQSSGNTDLNTLTTSGFYRLQNASPNDPTTNKYGQLLVIHGASDTITQILGDYGNGNLWTRSGNPTNVGGSGVWSSWKLVLDSGNSPYAYNMNQYVRTTDSVTFANGTVTGATMTYLTGAYQNTSVYDSAKTQSATPSRGIRAPASSIQFTDSYAIAPYYTYRSTGDWPVPYGIGWGTGGESSGIFQRYASNGYSFGDMIFYTGNDGYGAFSFRRHTWEGTAHFAAGSGELSTELFRVDWAGKATAISFGLTGGFVIDANGSYGQFNNWVHLPGYHGLYSSNNGAHFYPNNGTYGSWRIAGSRNSWYGLEFDSGTCLMTNSSEVGFYRLSYGWQMRWYAGTGYVYKGNPGGGTEATILDSSNQAYAWAMNQNVTTTSSPTFAAVSATTFTGALTGTASGNLTAASTLTAGNLSGTIPSGVLGNSTHYIGTTAITLNRTSSSQTLTGVNIDGNAGGSSTFVAGLGNNVNYDIDRTTKKAGLSHYSGYSTGTNRPTTFDYTLQVTDGGKGWEISMDWIATTGPAIYARSLRDCCQNWSSWVRILDNANYPYAANMNQNVRTTDSVTFAGATINGITINQERNTNARIYSATTGAMGLLGVNSGGTFRWQIYGDGSDYGFLDDTWGNWDIKKTINGQLDIRVGGSLVRVLNAGNYQNYSPTLTGTGANGNWGINITGNAATSDIATYARRIDGATRTSISVGGSSAAFYPVVLNIGAGSTAQQYCEFVIERGGYDDPGYTGIGFSNLNIRFTCKSSGWGFGATYENVEQHGATTPMVSDWYQVSQTSQLVVWLRGATIYYLWNVVGNTGVANQNSSGASITIANLPSYTYTFNTQSAQTEKAKYARYYNGENGTGIYTLGNIRVDGYFSGSGTGLTGTAAGLNIGGNAATVTNGLYTNSTLTAGNLSGTIPSGVLGNSTLYVGTTAITLNRSSASQTLTGVSIDGNAATATTLQTARAINGVNFNGSAAITVDGLNYSVNNAWLRENGDDAQFQMYGNSRTMIYRTDGNTNPHGGGGYAHIFYYGGSADAQRMFIINTDGRLWSNYHGWLDAMSISGNAATATSATTATTATTATNATVNSGNTSASWYPIVWHSGNTLYSTAGVTLYAGGSYIQTAYFNSSDDVSTGNISHIVAKFGDNYHRSATAAKVAAFITGQTMNINGSSTSCSGNAATCTTANAVAAGAIKAAGLDSSVEFTMTGLTSNSTIKIFPSYVSPYSSFLRMGYDNTGNYEYTIKRDGTTGFLEFYNTQANYTGYYFRINGSGGGLGIAVSPASRLHVNGDGTNPAVRVDNTGVVLAASVGSNGRTFYGWLPISVDGTTRWIRIFS